MKVKWNDGSQAHCRDTSIRTNCSLPFLSTFLPISHLGPFAMASSAKRASKRRGERTKPSHYRQMYLFDLTATEHNSTEKTSKQKALPLHKSNHDTAAKPQDIKRTSSAIAHKHGSRDVEAAPHLMEDHTDCISYGQTEHKCTLNADDRGGATGAVSLNMLTIASTS